MDAAASSPPPPVPADAERPVRVLVVDPDAATAARLRELLAESDGEGFSLDRAADVEDAAGRAAAAPPDVAVLRLPLPGDVGLAPFVALQARLPDPPVVVVCAAAEEPLGLKAVQLGAADVLLAEQLYGTLVARCLRHAVEAARVRALLARQREEALAFARERDTGARPASLASALPERFRALREEYAGLLDQAVEQAVYRVDHPVEEGLQRLARRAGELRAGPRDVVEIHAATMKERERDTGPQRMKIYAVEGRVRLLELMGYLAAYYRAAWVAAEGHGRP